ncbi:MAG: nucleotide-binding protein [Gemmataceae bacterium]|mgnify:CR=1 FL=1
MADWSARRCQAELMDRADVPSHEHEQALADLARLNRSSLAAWALWRQIGPLAQKCARPLRCLDLATGGGDIPITLARWARQRGISLELAGCDRSPTAVRWAQRQAELSQVPVHFFVCDLLAEPLPENFDILMCSLFLHHLVEADAIRLLKKMAHAARALVLVSDLERSALHYGLVWLATRLLVSSPIVRYDGPVSVRAAYSVAEVAHLARRAGWRDFRILRWFPCRYLLRYVPRSGGANAASTRSGAG